MRARPLSKQSGASKPENTRFADYSTAMQRSSAESLVVRKCLMQIFAQYKALPVTGSDSLHES
jgi:hypothetical protein